MNIVIKIYFQFYDGLLIVQFERIFINVIALIHFEILVEIIGERQYSRDLPQGGMELPALYVFKITNLEMHLQLPSLARKAMKTYNDAKTKAMDKPKLRQNKKMIRIFEHYPYTKKKYDEKYFCQVLFEIINLALIINANLFCSKV